MSELVAVLGGAGGIGRAVVRRFAADGKHVLVVDRDPAARELAAEVGGTAVVGDVTSPELLREALGGGSVSTLVHSVLGHHGAPLDQMSPALWHEVLDLGLISAWQSAQQVVSATTGPVSIVLIGSVHAEGVVPGRTAYAATKAGLVALAKGMAAEWGPRGVRCNVVQPGFVSIERNRERWAELAPAYPLGRPCRPEEIAELVAFLAGPAASYLNGAVLTADGGMTAVLPEVNSARTPADRDPAG